MPSSTPRDQAEHALPGQAKRPDSLLDYEEAAAILCCTPRLVRKLVETRKLESVKVASLVRIELAAIGRYIEANRRPAA
jgi:excisionase family DNA binding protein